MDYTEFLKRVDRSARFNDPQRAANVIKATLGTIGELLSPAERSNFASQMPKTLKECVNAWEHTEIAKIGFQGFSEDQFTNLVQARSHLNHRQTVRGIAAVTKVLKQAVSEGELLDLVEQINGYYLDLVEK